MMQSNQAKYIVNNVEKDLHIGRMLRTFFKKRRIYKSALARKLNRRYETVDDYQKKASLQIAILWEISHVLKHNFFADIAALLPPEYSTDTEIDHSQADLILELQAQIKQLSAERDMALKMMGK